MPTYIALFTDDTEAAINALDEEDAAWYAQFMSTDYNTDLEDIIPITDG